MENANRINILSVINKEPSKKAEIFYYLVSILVHLLFIYL